MGIESDVEKKFFREISESLKGSSLLEVLAKLFFAFLLIFLRLGVKRSKKNLINKQKRIPPTLVVETGFYYCLKSMVLNLFAPAVHLETFSKFSKHTWTRVLVFVPKK